MQDASPFKAGPGDRQSLSAPHPVPHQADETPARKGYSVLLDSQNSRRFDVGNNELAFLAESSRRTLYYSSSEQSSLTLSLFTLGAIGAN